jgi:hypothetical protein
MKTYISLLIFILLMPFKGNSQGIVEIELKINNNTIKLDENFHAFYFYKEQDSIIQSEDFVIYHSALIIGEKLYDPIQRYLVIKYDDDYFNIKLPNFNECDRHERGFTITINYCDSDCIGCDTIYKSICQNRYVNYQALYTYTISDTVTILCMEDNQQIKRLPVIGNLNWNNIKKE